MTINLNDFADAEQVVASAFEREVGVTGIPHTRDIVGNREFLKFSVGCEAPLYTYALYQCQRALPDDNPFKGAIGLAPKKTGSFPASIEANALLTLLTRSTREVSERTSHRGYSVPYVPFQRREDHQLAQPASHIVRGRRGVGKSTLIRRATDLLAETPSVVVTLDMQSYSTLEGDDLVREVLYDVCVGLRAKSEAAGLRLGAAVDTGPLASLGARIQSGEISTARVPVAIKRALGEVTTALAGNAYLFLDDFHLVDRSTQPPLLHMLNAAIKGANGWLKIAGLSSLLNVYEPKTGKGLQVPGDAQYIWLDLTLENPELAEAHLKAILDGFMKAVGYSLNGTIMPSPAFRRLAWANAGVPRDFLQMFGRSLEHATRNRHSTVTLSDVNVAIGEFGQQKADDLEKDARNNAGELREMLSRLEALCLDQKKINAFLVRSDNSRERVIVQILSDLRMVHLIHQSITPDRAGERFEAFILDYSLFTGFRRRPNVKEMIPSGLQFKASELRALPKIPVGFFKPQDSTEESS